MPAYLKIEYRSVPRYQRIASLLTVHNMSYQGQFWHWDMLLTGLDWKYFNWHQMEFHGNLNLLKTGMVFADSINTVSPRYAQEIQSGPLGCGLEGVLQYRRDVLSGILNGMDAAGVEPGDRSAPGRPITPPRRSTRASRSARRRCRRNWACRRTPDAPLVGFVGRLIDQKGIDLVADVMQRWVQTSDVQWAILGTGQPKYHKLLGTLAERFPQESGRAAGVLQSAGPSHRGRQRHVPHAQPLRALRAEPALQLAIRHGAVGAARPAAWPTRSPATTRSRRAPAANGFVFQEYSPLALGETSAPGVRRLPPAGDLAETGRRRHGARLVVGPQRQAVRGVVRKTMERRGIVD